MYPLFDLHSHLLCGVDDGAKTEQEMYAMLETAYKDGIRAICATPHYSPYLFGDTLQASEHSFTLLQEYVAKNHPDMYLFLGHELGYHHGALGALDEGKCRTVAGSRYVLVDFPESVDFFEIKSAMSKLMHSGYVPILAHTERYHALFSQLPWIENFVHEGGIVQLNASSVAGAGGMRAAAQWKKLVKKGLAHIISSDGHNLASRPPRMSVCLDYLNKHCSQDEILDLVWENACRVVRDEPI